MRILTPVRAQTICSHWHDGQWSALYQFASSGEWTIENCLRYLQEIESSLRPDFALYPRELKAKEELELKALEKFFIQQAKLKGIGIEWGEHKLYGYRIPYVTESTPDELSNKIKALLYAK